ncbi:hypothetical protein [Mameliella alba]|uniref:hypothetical protein n=1 Tax=Mameliella alba TaxID=561184 RepID=UPI001055FDA8|nr:hypothetical protein [Mameliella alba]GGF53496.1 hypothetical protein GCM10011319_13660 [Mameliella alba]
MIETERSKRWADLLRKEEEAFKKASNDSKEFGPARRELLAREWFEALAMVLTEYFRSLGQPGKGVPLYPFPGAAIGRAAGLAEHFAAGRIPLIVQDINAGGHPSRSPPERRDIATALSYIEHARAARISDRSFIKSVTEAFEVDRSTVRDWEKNRGEIFRGLTITPVEKFPSALRTAGARYKTNRETRPP